MKKIILLLMFASLLMMPLINADIITPGFRPLEINNIITNIKDFPDYYFLTVCTNPMPEASLIKEDGVIGHCYKYSELSVYAIRKSDFKEPYTTMMDYNSKNDTLFMKYLNSSIFKEVLSDIEHYKLVPISSTEESKTNYYAIDLSKIAGDPINTKTDRNFLIYFYIVIPLVALIIIVLIIRRKK